MLDRKDISDEKKSESEAVKADPQLRWKVEAWLKAQERQRYNEQPPKVFETFESYWKKVRYVTIERGLVEALLAIAEIEKRRENPETLEQPGGNPVILSAENSSAIVSQPSPPSESPNRRQEPGRVEKNMLITMILSNKEGAPVRESVMTENISHGGICVLSTQPLERGRYVQVITPTRKKSLIATVRESRSGPESKVHLHLQFVNQQWPFEADSGAVAN